MTIETAIPDVKALALAALEQRIKENETSATQARENSRRRSASMLLAEMEKKLGQGITEGAEIVFFGDESADAYAILPSIPNARFYYRHAGDYARGTLRMLPVLTIPDDPAYEDWDKNPLNISAPQRGDAYSLVEIGDVLKGWESADWTIYPWPEEKPERTESKTRFATLSIREANEETRPFRCLIACKIDGWLRLVVEYADVNGTPSSDEFIYALRDRIGL